jgi:alginate O-acetyltransferase complex protein AlgI
MSLSFWIRDYVFLPLAMLRREVWWRNLALVISMVLFGLWHRASLLFLVWGCYHGVLLVLHRQVQQAGRKFDWEPPATFWTPFSWLATMALINLGWIFFRANSLAQARQMLSAVVSPASYTSHFLSGSLYLLVAALALGYAIALMTVDAFDRSSAGAQISEGDANPGVIDFMVRWRWFWIPPLYALALLFLLIVTLTRGASTAQFMYNKF